MTLSDLEQIIANSLSADWIRVSTGDFLDHNVYKADISIRIIRSDETHYPFATPLLHQKLIQFRGYTDVKLAKLYVNNTILHSVYLVSLNHPEKKNERVILPLDAEPSVDNFEKLYAPLFSLHIARIFSNHQDFYIYVSDIFHCQDFIMPSDFDRTP